MATSAVESIVRWYFYYTWNRAFHLGPYVTRGIVHVDRDTWKVRVELTRGVHIVTRGLPVNLHIWVLHSSPLRCTCGVFHLSPSFGLIERKSIEKPF
jgi:hypothetical protein